MILSDYLCPDHGDFEATVPSPAPDAIACPVCGAASPWLPSPIVGRVKLGEVSRGKSDKAPTPYHLDMTELGEGMPLKEWKAKRRKFWQEHNWKRNKERG